jgi:hypothetical protein
VLDGFDCMLTLRDTTGAAALTRLTKIGAAPHHTAAEQPTNPYGRRLQRPDGQTCVSCLPTPYCRLPTSLPPKSMLYLSKIKKPA